MQYDFVYEKCRLPMVRVAILGLFLLLFFHTANAQNGFEVRGTVADSSGKGLAAATIRLITSKDTLYTTTHTNGSYSFSLPKQQDIDLLISIKGYASGHRVFEWP